MSSFAHSKQRLLSSGFLKYWDPPGPLLPAVDTQQGPCHERFTRPSLQTAPQGQVEWFLLLGLRPPTDDRKGSLICPIGPTGQSCWVSQEECKLHALNFLPWVLCPHRSCYGRLWKEFLLVQRVNNHYFHLLVIDTRPENFHGLLSGFSNTQNKFLSDLNPDLHALYRAWPLTKNAQDGPL